MSDIRILSAKYGFVPLDKRLASYNVRFGDAGQIGRAELDATASAEGIVGDPKVFVLGGLDYFHAVLSCNDAARRVLPSGLGLGKQIQWLTQHQGRWS